jgi:hypothetical protein
LFYIRYPYPVRYRIWLAGYPANLKTTPIKITENQA